MKANRITIIIIIDVIITVVNSIIIIIILIKLPCASHRTGRTGSHSNGRL